jgi:FkbM family methyltransferase
MIGTPPRCKTSKITFACTCRLLQTSEVVLMNPVTKILGALRVIARHPVNRHRKLKAVLEYGFIQTAARLVPGDICVEFPNHTRLLVSPRMKGAAHYIAPRLCEFEEMAFVMHFLRPGELFVDVGANVGAFTILAAGVAGAKVRAFEPNPDTFEMLERNVRLNGLQERVTPVRAAVGQSEGTIQLTTDLGTENHVTTGATAKNSATVKMVTLDKELSEAAPDLLKVDTEGFETEVFSGATNLLQRPQLRAMIVERSDSGKRYGFDEAALHRQIRQCGFIPCRYDPFARRLSRVENEVLGNIIYVRDIPGTDVVLRAAPAFKLDDLSV